MSAIKFMKFKVMIALPKKFGSKGFFVNPCPEVIRYENANNSWHFLIYYHRNCQAQLC